MSHQDVTLDQEFRALPVGRTVTVASAAWPPDIASPSTRKGRTEFPSRRSLRRPSLMRRLWRAYCESSFWLLVSFILVGCLTAGLTIVGISANTSHDVTLRPNPTATLKLDDDSPRRAGNNTVPRTKSPSNAKPKPQKQLPATYVVRKGDTLRSIVKQFGRGLTWQRLCALNSLQNCDLINHGEQLRLTGKVNTVSASNSSQARVTSAHPSKSVKAKTTKKRLPRHQGSHVNRQKRASYAPGTASSTATKAIDFARRQVGKWYRYGAAGPKNFDCSGLTMRAWQYAGVRIPRTANQQYHSLRHITRSQLRPGDLVFRIDRHAHADHVAMYIGNGKVIAARRTGTQITVQSVALFNAFAAVGH